MRVRQLALAAALLLGCGGASWAAPSPEAPTGLNQVATDYMRWHSNRGHHYGWYHRPRRVVYYRHYRPRYVRYHHPRVVRYRYGGPAFGYYRPRAVHYRYARPYYGYR